MSTAPITTVSDLRGVARRDDGTAAFFDGLAAGVLRTRRCTRCRHWTRPDATACPSCHHDTLEWEQAGATGTVVSRIVDHTPEKDGDSALTLGLVELDEGPWLHARLVDGAGIGVRVELVVLTDADNSDSEAVPAFRSSS